METAKIITAVLIWAVSCAIIVSEVQAQVDRPLENAFAALDRRAKSRMLRAARVVRVPIVTNNALHIYRSGGYLGTSAVIQGVENLGPQDFAGGANVGFTYIRLEEANVPPGFYTMRVTGGPGVETSGELVDRRGNVIRTFPAEIEVGDIPLGGEIFQPYPAFEIGHRRINLHWHWDFLSLRVWIWVHVNITW